MSKKKQNNPMLKKLIAVYFIMTMAVIGIVCMIVLIVMGFGFDPSKGQIEQYSFLHFGSSPSGATISVNEEALSSKTPSKKATSAGKYDVVLSKNGYEDWQKTVETKAGVISWLNYALLVPKNRKVESVLTYDSIHNSLASPKKQNIIVQEKIDVPSFDLVDISSDDIKMAKITIPLDTYSESSTEKISHKFEMIKWNPDDRYVLIRHYFNDKDEWLVLDIQNVSDTKNITKTLNLSIKSIDFSDSSGRKFYALESNDIRKLDLLAGTISKPLVSDVDSFQVSDDGIISFVGVPNKEKDTQVAGIYIDNNEKSYNLRTTKVSADLHISTAHYFKEDYVAISEGDKVDVWGGSYPNVNSKDASSLNIIKSYDLKSPVKHLAFSPSGEYVFSRSDDDSILNYDLEYGNLYEFKIDKINQDSKVKWLDNNYLWSDSGSSLTMREFDGGNVHEINKSLTGQDVVLTDKKNYLYSFNKVNDKFQLQRVRMILP